MILHQRRSIYNIQPTNLVCCDHPYHHYRTVTDFIKRFLDQTLLKTLKIIENLGEITFDERSGVTTRKLGYFGNDWPTCGSFTTRNGLESVINEMESWNALSALKDWMFHATFIGLRYRNTIEVCTYQVLWSVPTPAYPEPQVTVSVFFYIAQSRVYPAEFPVDVTYVFEGHHFSHSLNMIFRPKWLYDILDMKTMMFKTFNF
ncbi:A-kinase anchor protein 14 [Anthophora plagiata]